MPVKFPNVEVQLSGQDGNVFGIIGRVTRALKKGGATAEQAEEFQREVTNSGSYDEALQVVMKWVEVA